MQDIDRNRTSLTSPAMEDVYNSELIYLLKNNETERYLTTYDPIAYSNEYSIVERMVVDKKRKFTDESMNRIDDRLNELMNMGIVDCIGKIKCEYSGKTVGVYKVILSADKVLEKLKKI